MAILKQSTGYTRLFLMVDSTSHITGATGLTVTVTISKAGAAFGPTTNNPVEVSGGSNGWYTLAVSTTDTATVGDLAFHATATGADPTDWADQVQPHVFNDLTLDANGNVSVTSSVKKNVTKNGYMFVMTDATTHAPKPGLGGTITAQRAIDGGAFSATANSPTEVANGVYAINLAAADVNGNHVMLYCTATGADPFFTEFTTQP